MRHFLLGGLAATFIGFGMMGSASALPALLDPSVKTSTEAGVELTQVQVRRQGGGARVGNRGGARAFNRGGARFGNRGGARYGYRGGYRGGYGGGYRRGYGGGYDGGAAVGAGILGLAAGAIIGGAVANSSGGNASCAQRFRSYDPSSGTYLGYDGARHACP